MMSTSLIPIAASDWCAFGISASVYRFYSIDTIQLYGIRYAISYMLYEVGIWPRLVQTL